MDSPSVDRDTVLEQLGRVLSSDVFRRAERSAALLRYLTERTLDGDVDRLKEYTLGTEVLGRGSSFDPRMDPVVRAEASRLRDRLARYYGGGGRDDPVLLRLPKGSYVLQFEHRPPDNVVASGDAAPEQRSNRGGPHRALWFGSGAGVVAIAVAALAWLRAQTDLPNAGPLQQFEVELRVDGTLGSEVGPDVVLSADGTRLVFVARDAGGRAHLYTRRLDEPTVTLLPGTDGARVPFLSPDGRWIGFWADGKVKRIAVGGGAPVVLCDATDMLGASWGRDGHIIAALNPTGKLWRIPETGGAPRPLIDLATDSASPVWPRILPGDKVVLYSVNGRFGADRATIEAATIATGERKVLVRGGTFPTYMSNGFLMYVNQGTLYAVPFDTQRLELRGTPIPMLADVEYSRTFGYAQLDVAQSGALVYRRAPRRGPFIAAMVDRVGGSAPFVVEGGRYNWLRLSPDGKRAAFTSVESGAAAVGVVTLRDQSVKRLRGVSGEHTGLVWWPDGRRLLVGGRAGIAWIDVDGDGALRPLSNGKTIQVPWSLSPNARRLAYHELNPAFAFDLWTASVSDSSANLALAAPELFLRTPAYEVYPAFSPDGRWIAYASNESGRYQIYVRAFPDNGTATQVSTGGGRIPLWSPTRPELLYQTDDQQLMVATYRVDDGRFVVGGSQPWTSRLLGDAGVFPTFDVAADGERVAALLPAVPPSDRQTPNHVTFMLNFQTEVQRHAGL